jgi:hypothetical protein
MDMVNKQLSFTIFDWLKHITVTKQSWSSFTENEKELFNPWLIHKFVSMLEDYIDVANFGQKIPYSEKEKTYKYYCSMLPKNNVFFKYIKKSRKRPNENVLQHIANYYTISIGEAEDYAYILKQEGIEMILKKSGINEKEIKKLLKDLNII